MLPASAPQHNPSPAALGPRKPLALVVTEDVLLASTCQGALEQAGFNVVYAKHSGHALLECLSGYPADILIAELSMPDGTGPALAERLRRYSPELQAVYVGNPGTLLAAPNILLRPFTREDLIARVRGGLTVSPAS